MDIWLNAVEMTSKKGDKYIKVFCTIDGEEQEAALFAKESKKGGTYYTGKLKPKEAYMPPASVQKDYVPDDSDPIPFAFLLPLVASLLTMANYFVV